MRTTPVGTRVAVSWPETPFVNEGVLFTQAGTGAVRPEIVSLYCPCMVLVPEVGRVEMLWGPDTVEALEPRVRQRVPFPRNRNRSVSDFERYKVGDPCTIDGVTSKVQALLRLNQRPSDANDLPTLPLTDLLLRFERSEGVARGAFPDSGVPVTFESHTDDQGEVGLGIWSTLTAAVPRRNNASGVVLIRRNGDVSASIDLKRRRLYTPDANEWITLASNRLPELRGNAVVHFRSDTGSSISVPAADRLLWIHGYTHSRKRIAEWGAMAHIDTPDQCIGARTIRMESPALHYFQLRFP